MYSQRIRANTGLSEGTTETETRSIFSETSSIYIPTMSSDSSDLRPLQGGSMSEPNVKDLSKNHIRQSPGRFLTSCVSKSVDSGVDPATLQSSHTIIKPTSVDEVYGLLESLREKLPSTTTPISQFLFVQDIPDEIFASLDSGVPRGVCRTILPNKRQILFRITPSRRHDQMCVLFNLSMAAKLMLMDLFPVRHFWATSTERHRGQSSSKEPDFAFHPGLTLEADEPTPWPTLVIESGFSESLAQLRIDAHWWLASSNHQTQFVILISARPSKPNNATLEVWRPVKAPGRVTRSGETYTARRVSLTTFVDGIFSGDEVKLDFQSLMGRPPQNLRETDISFSAAELQGICLTGEISRSL